MPVIPSPLKHVTMLYSLELGYSVQERSCSLAYPTVVRFSHAVASAYMEVSFYHQQRHSIPQLDVMFAVILQAFAEHSHSHIPEDRDIQYMRYSSPKAIAQHPESDSRKMQLWIQRHTTHHQLSISATVTAAPPTPAAPALQLPLLRQGQKRQSGSQSMLQWNLLSRLLLKIFSMGTCACAHAA